MVRTKTKKFRGSHYGRGMKSGRGKGKRGGAGNAGLGKHKWLWTLKNDPLHFGGKGFTSHHPSVPDVTITLNELADKFDWFKGNGYVKEEKGKVTIDLRSAGYTKILGTGDFRLKSTILVDKATEKSINKLSSHGITVEFDGGHREE